MIMRKILELLVVGKITRGVTKGVLNRIRKTWLWVWREVDRIIGLIIRELYKRTLTVDNNKVFFFSQEFRYCCNPKYICEEFLYRGLDSSIDIVWRVNPKGDVSSFPDRVRTVKAGTLDFYKEIFTAKYIVANSYVFLDQTLFLKKDQVLFQTWHGSLGIKRFGKNDMKDGWRRIWASQVTGKMTDYCITNGSFVSGSLANTYWPNTPKLEYGHPRNDIFFEGYLEKRKEIKERICENLDIDVDCKILMYAPTFRDTKQLDCYDIDFSRLRETLEKKYGGEWIILLKYHPSLRKLKSSQKVITELSGFVKNITNYSDMQELISITDIAVTDYSSWIYDFMLLRRPGFIYATDIEMYNNERGFCYPIETTPFPITTNNDELNDAILNFDNEKYIRELEAFLVDKGCTDDGHASERTVDKILELMEANKKKDQ